MDESEFTARVVPCVSKLFTSTDRSIRRSLLENIDAYGKHLTQVGSSAQTLMLTFIDTQMHTFLAFESINLDSGSRAFKNAQSKLPMHVCECNSMLQLSAQAVCGWDIVS